VVSWKLSESIAIQSTRLADDLTARSYESLQLPHQTFTLLMREDIRHSAKDLSQNPILLQEYEARRLKAVREELRTASIKDELDFILLLNMKGQLESSFPPDLHDFDVEDYVKEWAFGAYVHEHILRADPEEHIEICVSDRNRLHRSHCSFTNTIQGEAFAVPVISLSYRGREALYT
jgi:hypothetical protein